MGVRVDTRGVRNTDYIAPWVAPTDMESRIQSAVRAVLFAREADLHPQMRDRIVAQVLWFATEVPTKYATRYRSHDAWKRQLASKRVNEWVGYVAHEHVWTRAASRDQLLAAPDAEALREVVSGLQGCVVTRAEHERLLPFDKSHVAGNVTSPPEYPLLTRPRTNWSTCGLSVP